MTILVGVQSGYGYPISPRPLRLLIEESEIIVFARVTDIVDESGKRKDDDFETTVAILQIYNVVQGTVNQSVIRVPYPANFICPAPPHFEKGKDVLVFLNKRNDQYAVHALSYGVKTVTAAEAQVYINKIKEMQDIMKIKNEDERFIKTTEWLVGCAENPVTRYEGTYELSPESSFMSFYDQSEGKPFKYVITAEQKVRLENALFAVKKLSYEDLGLIDLVYASNGEKVFRFMLSKLKEQSQQGKPQWFADSFMNRLNLYKSSPRTKELEEKYSEVAYAQGTKPEDLKNVLRDFVAEMERLP